MLTFLVLIALLFVGTIVVGLVQGNASHQQAVAQAERLSPSDRAEFWAQRAREAEGRVHGPVNAAIMCPHCQARGGVRTKAIDRKKGISGGKATAAVLTGGVSMLATGLSRKEAVTRARCDNCKNAWDF